MSNNYNRTFALEVTEKLRAAGHEALWAGGCVRDLLLGNEPADYDVATSAKPDEVRKLFGHARTLAIGASFGVIVVLPPRGSDAEQIEVATFRTDAAYSDGRRPDHIQFSTPEEDALRRDFTINGMFYDPIKEQVIDYVGGREDLQTGIVRAIGNAADRIHEDKLRMLRAVRFAARFGFGIDGDTRTAVRENATDVKLVSGERIAVEVKKTLQTTRAAWGVAELFELGLLEVVLPEVAESWPDKKAAAMQLLEAMNAADWIEKLAGLLLLASDQNTMPASVRACCLGIQARLKLANADVEALEYAIIAQPDLDGARTKPWSTLQPRMVHDSIRTAMELHRARSVIGGDEANHAWLEAQLRRAPEDLNPSPFLDGGDLIALGAKPGPRFKALLADARALQLDGVLRRREDAMEWARKKFDEA